MKNKDHESRLFLVLRGLLFALLLAGFNTFGVQTAHADQQNKRPLCDENAPLCTEVLDSLNYDGTYTGHDEPSVLFYSNVAGSGNSNVYVLTLPNDPPITPKQDGTGGTFNFQLHPAFWFGMAMCDSQSAPNPAQSCTPDSDANIFDGADPTKPDYIGKHPGTAFMEMQFYPPGWAPWPAGNSCDSNKWCAALNIDSLSENQNTSQVLNSTCADVTGLEYVNFAFITKNGKTLGPANPVQHTLATFTPDPAKVLFMKPGDKLVVTMHDTRDGFQVIIQDLTTGETGSMTASIANGFGQVKFAPSPSTECTNIPYAFHPMYSTSSEHTRVPWAAHSYNIAFSDEIGHFEYCNQVNSSGQCMIAGINDPNGVDADDVGCFSATSSTRIAIAGCTGTDDDFDGVPYQHTWPGSIRDRNQDVRFNPRSVLFTSPLFTPVSAGGTLSNYSRVAFETDLPRIEDPGVSSNNNCNRSTGAGCVNPPNGANFYPIYSTHGGDLSCVWQLGGPYVPGTKNTFGGTSTAEYGSLLQLVYPSPSGPSFRYNDFRQVLSYNPCEAKP
jgi:hypothetical protein